MTAHRTSTVDAVPGTPLLVFTRILPPHPRRPAEAIAFIQDCLRHIQLTTEDEQAVATQVTGALAERVDVTAALHLAVRAFADHIEVDVLQPFSGLPDQGGPA